MEQEPKENKEQTPAADSGNGPDTQPTQPQTGETAAPQAGNAAEKELLYLRAEFDNYRKRILREQESAVRFANERFVRELLPIVNLFDRALAAAAPLKAAEEKKPEIQNFVLGIEMTHRELVQTLERAGVELIGVKGEKFSPERHEAISQVETSHQEPGTVADVLERGALLQGRLIQPAKVTVAKASDAAPPKA